MPNPADERHILYELCVQRPGLVVELIRSAHAAAANPGTSPARVMHEDFSGTGAVSRMWVATDQQARAVATDLDPEALAYGASRAAESQLAPTRLHWHQGDVRLPDEQSHTQLADAIFVGNFSIGELHTRGELIAYLRNARSRLNRSGVFICDTYGGAAAFRTGLVHRTHTGREPAERILYTWEQRSIDAYTARVANALHFRVEHGGEIIAEHFDAFVYHWRLWSVPELREAMRQAGFAATCVLDSIGMGDGPAPPKDLAQAAEHHIVCIAARR